MLSVAWTRKNPPARKTEGLTCGDLSQGPFSQYSVFGSLLDPPPCWLVNSHLVNPNSMLHGNQSNWISRHQTLPGWWSTAPPCGGNCNDSAGGQKHFSGWYLQSWHLRTKKPQISGELKMWQAREARRLKRMRVDVMLIKADRCLRNKLERSSR
jgi:hypothetical protein